MQANGGAEKRSFGFQQKLPAWTYGEFLGGFLYITAYKPWIKILLKP